MTHVARIPGTGRAELHTLGMHTATVVMKELDAGSQKHDKALALIHDY